MTTIPALDHIEVPRPLAQDQINLYLEDGYLVIPEVLTPGEIGELKREIVEIAKGKYPSDNFQPLATDISDDDAVSNILAIHHPHLISPVIVKYAQHPEICGMLGQIVAAHLPFWDGSVKCMQTMLFVKPPSFQGQAWHQDELYIQTRDRSLTGCGLRLTMRLLKTVVSKSFPARTVVVTSGHSVTTMNLKNTILAQSPTVSTSLSPSLSKWYAAQ